MKGVMENLSHPKKKIRLYNTKSREVEEFKPISESQVSIYSCGPTVYNFAHVGNLRAYVFVDVLKRTLQWAGYQTKHVMNLTDVGHLTNDSDDGDDKMEEAAKKSGKDIWDLARFYSTKFFEHTAELSILPPDHICRATDYIQEQIDLIKQIESRGAAYKLTDGLYLDTSKVEGYAEFAKLSLEGQKEGARVEAVEGKKNPTDFALWKFCEEGNRQMEWESPWGRGFPGWHIECSAMSKAFFGDRFDIHTGGIDHIPVHHTNEIAQMRAATGCKEWVNYWMHNNFIVLEKSGDSETEKMAKSGGNFITLSTLKSWGLDPMAYRYFLLNTHYRKEARFTKENIEASHEGWKSLVRAIADVSKASSTPWFECQKGKDLDDFVVQLDEAMSQDLNTAKALAALHTCLKSKDVYAESKLHFISQVDRLLGLRLLDSVALEPSGELNLAGMEDVIRMRQKARADKNYAAADTIRDVCAALGISFKDSPEGTTYELR